MMSSLDVRLDGEQGYVAIAIDMPLRRGGGVCREWVEFTFLGVFWLLFLLMQLGQFSSLS
jgi:hypothetical protein